MKQIIPTRKALFTLAIAASIALPAAAAQPMTPASGLTCAWGDASFEEGCASAAAAANAKAIALVQSARTKVASAPFRSTLYRNGGYFGDKNSDAMLENSDQVLAGAPSDSTVAESASSQQTAYQGNLYRNGGYFGDKNSDERLER